MPERLNDWRAFVISIKRKELELGTTLGLLSQQGILVEVFYGIDAMISGIDHTEHCYEVDHPNSNYHIGALTINLNLSHFMLWKMMSYQPDDAFIVFEDDVRIRDGWKESTLEAIKKLPPDWDLFYLGSCCCMGQPHKKLINKGKHSLYQIYQACCTHGYVVRKKALKILLDRCEKIWAPLDLAISIDCIPHLQKQDQPLMLFLLLKDLDGLLSNLFYFEANLV